MTLVQCSYCGKASPRPINPHKERWPWDEHETWCYGSANTEHGIFCSFDHRQEWIEQLDPQEIIIRVPHGPAYARRRAA